MRHKKRRNWPIALVCLGLLILFCGYAFGLPWLSLHASRMWHEASSLPRMGPPPFVQQVRFRSFEFLVTAWFFMLGASIGSFLNVVIYRTPRGLSLLGSSRCPFCRSKIRSYDNIPVFAWIALRARCRDCGLPISPRYPLIEAVTGLIFVALAILELFLAGENLPADYGNLRLNLTWLMGRVPGNLVAVFLYHATLLSILLSWAMIKFDGYALPRLYIIAAMAVGLAVPAINPAVQPVRWTSTVPAWIAQRGGLDRLDTSLVGLAGGLIAGLALTVAQLPNRRRPRGPSRRVRDTMAVFGTVGLYLGWQAVLSVAVLGAGVRSVSALRMTGKREMRVASRKPPFGGGESATPFSAMFLWVLLATAAQIALWRWLGHLAWWPGPNCSAAATLAAAAIAVLLTLAASIVEPLRLPSGDIPQRS